MDKEFEITMNIAALENELYKCNSLLRKAVICGNIGRLKRELHNLQHPFKKKEANNENNQQKQP